MTHNIVCKEALDACRSVSQLIIRHRIFLSISIVSLVVIGIGILSDTVLMASIPLISLIISVFYMINLANKIDKIRIEYVRKFSTSVGNYLDNKKNNGDQVKVQEQISNNLSV